MANIGERMRRHQVIPLDHPIPATEEPNPYSKRLNIRACYRLLLRRFDQKLNHAASPHRQVNCQTIVTDAPKLPKAI
jgi:hypothetical protein